MSQDELYFDSLGDDEEPESVDPPDSSGFTGYIPDPSIPMSQDPQGSSASISTDAMFLPPSGGDEALIRQLREQIQWLLGVVDDQAQQLKRIWAELWKDDDTTTDDVSGGTDRTVIGSDSELADAGYSTATTWDRSSGTQVKPLELHVCLGAVYNESGDKELKGQQVKLVINPNGTITSATPESVYVVDNPDNCP